MKEGYYFKSSSLLSEFLHDCGKSFWIDTIFANTDEYRELLSIQSAVEDLINVI